MNEIKAFLSKNQIEFVENFEIASISTIKLGEIISLAIFPKDEKQLRKIILRFFAKKTYFKVIGNASNVLFVSRVGYPVVITSKMQDNIKISGLEVKVSAGVLLSKLSDVLRKNELSGFEGLAAIPATIGGAIVNGAGAFGYNIYDRLVSIQAIVEGNEVEIFKNQINFKHHYSNLNGVFVLSAKFLFEKKSEYDIIKLLNKFSYMRTSSQPAGFSLGSVYQKASEQSAGFFIERAGLKGKRFGGVMVSNKHANFFVNDGSGSVVDFLRLASFVETTVGEHFGISLLPEIEKVGEKNETDWRLSYSFKKL